MKNKMTVEDLEKWLRSEGGAWDDSTVVAYRIKDFKTNLYSEIIQPLQDALDFLAKEEKIEAKMRVELQAQLAEKDKALQRMRESIQWAIGQIKGSFFSPQYPDIICNVAEGLNKALSPVSVNKEDEKCTNA